MSQSLSGKTFRYRYNSDIAYTISFDKTHVFFTNPKLVGSRVSEDKTFIRLPYAARELRPDLILVHWLTTGRAGHVALVYDFANGTVNASALMPGQFELFANATIEHTWENGENAIWNM